MKFILSLLLLVTSGLIKAESSPAQNMLKGKGLLPQGLHLLHQGEGNPILLIHGINPDPDLPEWVNPLNKLLEDNRTIYFHRWSKYKSMEKNHTLLTESYLDILSENENKDLTVIGFSAGGVIALMAKHTLKNNPFDQRITLHTGASPVFGYGAPRTMSFLIAPIVGSTTITLGVGMPKKIIQEGINQCFHWVTTDCEKDKHACPFKEGRYSQISESMPCGTHHTISLPDADHTSILQTIVDSL